MSTAACPPTNTAAPSAAAFAAALLDPTRPAPAGLQTHNGSDPGVRFNVYRNNVVAALTGALAASFPVITALIGPPRFATLAHAFIAAAPPTAPVLTAWGEAFADFIAAFPPAAGYPLLPDLARLEWLWLRAAQAADAPALTAPALASRLAAPAALLAARPRLHPTVGLLASPYPVVSLWAAWQQDPRPAPLPSPADLPTGRGEPEQALVVRTGGTVAVVPIPPATAAFIAALAAGQPLAAAAGAADGLDLGLSLAILIRHEALCAWD
ncbi:MAG: DUF2063 domain-containing protein [Chromatiaceae bacterium]|jgi:hypothetical protein|nr:MAG: DUF2063 domain-containing protein [Chromatiaceae bacterium]